MAPFLVPATPMSLLTSSPNFTSTTSSSPSKMSNITNMDDGTVTGATYAAFCNPPRRAKRHRSDSLMPANNVVGSSVVDLGVTQDQMSFPPSSVAISSVEAYNSSSTKTPTNVEPQQQLSPTLASTGLLSGNTGNSNANTSNASSAAPNTGKRRGRKPGTLSRAARESQRKLNHSRIEKARRLKINDALAALRELVPSDYTSNGNRLSNNIDIDGSDDDDDDDYASKAKPQKKEDKEFKLEILERTVVFLRDMMARVEVLEKERKTLLRGYKGSGQAGTKGTASTAETLAQTNVDMKVGPTICAKCASKDVTARAENNGATSKPVKRKRAENEDGESEAEKIFTDEEAKEIEEIHPDDEAIFSSRSVGAENKEEERRMLMRSGKMGNVVGWQDASESSIKISGARYSQVSSHTEVQDSRPRRGRAYTQPEMSLPSTEGRSQSQYIYAANISNNQRTAISMRNSFSTSAVENPPPPSLSESNIGSSPTSRQSSMRLPSISALLDETQFTVSPRAYTTYSASAPGSVHSHSNNVSPNLDITCKNNSTVQMLSPRTTPLTGPVQSSRYRSPPDNLSLSSNALLPSPALMPTASAPVPAHVERLNFGHSMQLPSPPNSARSQPIRHIQPPPALALPSAAVRPFRSNSGSDGSGAEERADVRMNESCDESRLLARQSFDTEANKKMKVIRGHNWTREEESAASLLLVIGGKVGSSTANAGDSSAPSSYTRGCDHQHRRANINTDSLENTIQVLPPMRSATTARDEENYDYKVGQRPTTGQPKMLVMTPTSLMESTSGNVNNMNVRQVHVYPPINSSNKLDAQTPASVLGINVHSRS